MTSYPSAYLEFIRLFNERHFFEAHEVLEGLWRKEKSADRDFFQGLIQIAALFVHLQKKNRFGAERLMKTASAYFQPYAPRHYGIQIKTILEQAEAAIATAEGDQYITFFEIKVTPDF